MSKHAISGFICTLLCLSMAGLATAQDKSLSSSVGLFVYPANNQPPEQQSKDDYECFSWAKGQTGHDPMNPQPIQVATQQTETGPDGSALRGAARGAVIGEVANDDAGKGAAYGAAVGAVRGRRARKAKQRDNEQDAQAQASSIAQQRDVEFKNAFSACLSARGYSVN
jgi:hypothetical protein